MKHALYLLLFSLATGSAYACSCLPIFTFCESITGNDGNLRPSLDIIRGKITETTAAGARFRIDVTYLGDAPRSTIFIRNGSSAWCTLSTEEWSVGDEFLLAFHWEAGRDSFHIGSCGVPLLRIEGGLARGPIAPGIRRLPPEQILGLPGCGDAGNELGRLPALLFPNPASTGIQLVLESEEPVTGDWSIHDARGRLLRQEKQVTLNQLALPCADWPGGVYLLVLRTPFDRRTFRFVRINE